MSAPSRTALLNKIYKVLKKHFKPVAPPAGRTLLEHLLYACCLENARPEAADEAFAKLQPPCFIDWNEVRVTSKTELAEEVANKLPLPLAAATHIKLALQGVFESQFAFDIEFLRKQNLGKSENDLGGYAGGSQFIQAYVVQHGLGGHAIPCSQSMLDVLYILGAITDSEHEKKIVPGIERAIPKSKGVEFGSLLQQLAADFQASPQNLRVRAILTEIDPESKDRLPKRNVAKKDAAADKASKDAARKPVTGGPTGAADASGKKASRPEAKLAAKPPAKPQAKPIPPKSKTNKSEPTRAASESRAGAGPRLAKKKPR